MRVELYENNVIIFLILLSLFKKSLIDFYSFSEKIKFYLKYFFLIHKSTIRSILTKKSYF